MTTLSVSTAPEGPTCDDNVFNVGTVTTEDLRATVPSADDLWALIVALPDSHPAHRDARNQLVDLHMPLARHLARRYDHRGEPSEDLLQVASIGLIKAVDRFDPGRGLAFSTFAMPTILGEIKRHFRDRTAMVRIPRPLQELKTRLVIARDDLSQSLGRSPTVAEIAAHLGTSQEEVLDTLEAANAYSASSIDQPVNEEDGAGSALERKLSVIDAGIDLVERRQCVMPLLDALSERDRRIIFLRFFRDMTQQEIAKDLGISQMHVSRLLTSILAQLQRRLAEDSAPLAS